MDLFETFEGKKPQKGRDTRCPAMQGNSHKENNEREGEEKSILYG